MVRHVPILFVVLISNTVSAADGDAMQIFNDRIMPIFRSDKPSSCVQCHLASVDLKDYIRPSQKDTFAALRQQGLVDVDRPLESKILKLIRMGDADQDARARRIHEKTRQLEFSAFQAWIKACCADSELRTATAEEGVEVGPAADLHVVRHTRKSRLVESFAQKIWSQRMRCFPCHTPHEFESSNPKHSVGKKRYADLAQKFGRRMDIFGETPEATLDRLVASSRRKIPGRLPLLNLEEPANSLLVLKPTARLPSKLDDGEFDKPSSVLPVSHMGGLKMHRNDPSYKSFVAWIQDYANAANGKYISVDDLPQDNWIATQKILRVKDIPQSWGKSPVVQLFVYAASEDGAFGTRPVAFTQGPVTPRRMVNGPLFLLPDLNDESTHPNPLKGGRFLVKICVDHQAQLEQHPELLLDTTNATTQFEIQAKWQDGWKLAEVHSLNL